MSKPYYPAYTSIYCTAVQDEDEERGQRKRSYALSCKRTLKSIWPSMKKAVNALELSGEPIAMIRVYTSDRILRIDKKDFDRGIAYYKKTYMNPDYPHPEGLYEGIQWIDIVYETPGEDDDNDDDSYYTSEEIIAEFGY